MKFRRLTSLGFAVALTATAASSAYGSSSKYQQTIDYLKSPARVQRFNPFVTKVGLVLAEALEAGKFGPITKYNDYKKPLRSSYVGWGGIESTNRVAFVWVFWRHGAIDFSKPITQIGIEAKNKPSTQVLVFSPSNPEPYWSVSVGYDNMESTSTAAIQDPGQGLDKPIKHGKYTLSFTTSLKQIKQLDARALSLLNSDMTSQFGKAWTG